LVSAVVTFLLLVVLSLVPMACSADAQSEVELSTGGSVYVSAYSKIFAGPKGVTVSLTSLLSIRNTDSKFPITILRMDYYDSEGRLIRSFIEKPIQVRPLGSIHYYLNQHTEGGPGAKFIVTWCSQEPVNKPIIESLMSDRSGTQGISFRCPGREITEHGE
jgi:hypothetical protein